MKLAVVVGLLVVYGVEGSMFPEQLKHTLHKWNLLSRCWGEENMVQYAAQIHKATEHCQQLAPIHSVFQDLSGGSRPFQTLPGNLGSGWRTKPANNLPPLPSPKQWAALWAPYLQQQRFKRAVVDFDEAEMQEFMEQVMDFKEGMASKIGNLTCVLTQMGQLDSNMNINKDFFLEGVWEEFPAAGYSADPALANKMKTGFSDCYDIAENWPQASLNRHPLTKKFGRHMIFFHCVEKVELKLCAKAEMLDWLETWYGKADRRTLRQLGLPEDKYDAALLSMNVLDQAMSPEEKFIEKFFWGKNEM